MKWIDLVDLIICLLGLVAMIFFFGMWNVIILPLGLVALAGLCFFALDLKYIYHGMVPRWVRQHRFSFDAARKTLRIEGLKFNKEIDLSQAAQVRWILLDWLEASEKNHASFFARQSLEITQNDGRAMKYRFDVPSVREFVKRIEGSGVSVKEKNVNDPRF